MTNSSKSGLILTLPGILFVEIALEKDIVYNRNFTVPSASTITGVFETLPTVGLSTFSQTTEMVKGEVIYTYQLSAEILEAVGYNPNRWNGKPVAVLARDVYGYRYVMAANDKPYPLAKTEFTIEGETSGKRSYKVTVTWKTPLEIEKI